MLGWLLRILRKKKRLILRYCCSIFLEGLNKIANVKSGYTASGPTMETSTFRTGSRNYNQLTSHTQVLISKCLYFRKLVILLDTTNVAFNYASFSHYVKCPTKTIILSNMFKSSSRQQQLHDQSLGLRTVLPSQDNQCSIFNKLSTLYLIIPYLHRTLNITYYDILEHVTFKIYKNNARCCLNVFTTEYTSCGQNKKNRHLSVCAANKTEEEKPEKRNHFGDSVSTRLKNGMKK